MRISQIAAGSRWLKATAHGPLASRSCSSSTVWAVWSEALAQRSCPSASTSISPAPSAENSCLAASAICCKVGARPRCGSRLPRPPMLLARSVGSIGMARLPFWYRTDEPVSRALQQGGKVAKRTNSRRVGRAGRGLGPGSYQCQVARRIRNNAHNCTPATPLLKAARQPGQIGGHCRWLDGPCSLGLHPLQRTRCGGQVGLALACLHRQPEAASMPAPSPGSSPTRPAQGDGSLPLTGTRASVAGSHDLAAQSCPSFLGSYVGVREIATGSPGREDRGRRRVRGASYASLAAPPGGT